MKKMKIMNANCPNCGAALEFDENDSQTVCEYCDSVIILDNENKSKEYEDAGYSFEMGRQKAREELNGRYIPQQNTYQNVAVGARVDIYVSDSAVDYCRQEQKNPNVAQSRDHYRCVGFVLFLGRVGRE